MWDWHYRPSKPRKPKTSVQAKTQRGAFGQSWWAKRWIGVLETFGWSNRLQRGRSYARNGQVMNIDIQVGEVKAQVQGSRPQPYKVQIAVEPLDKKQWDKAIDAMAAQAIFSAKLLAGEMPQDIEEAFQAAKVPLFPQQAKDIHTDCSCPDFANPCKHIAAVYYLLGEQFDEDPFVLFALRGRTKDEVMQALQARRATAAPQVEEADAEPAPVEQAPALADELATFYLAGEALNTLQPHIVAPEVEAALLRRLGVPPANTETDLSVLYPLMTQYALRKVFEE